MMAKKILLATLGGTPEPLKISINFHRPDIIYFICSVHRPGQKGSCGLIEEISKALSQDFFQIQKIEIENADSFQEIFSKVIKEINILKNNYPEAEIILDYSGGTKTMSLAAALAGIEENLGVYFTGGLRNDLVKVMGETSTPAKIEVEDYKVKRFLSIVNTLWSNHFYKSAASLLRDFQSSISEDKREKIKIAHHISLAFGFWDRFLYGTAYEILRQYGRWEEVRKYLSPLSILKKATEGEKHFPGEYFIVKDLILNAQRRVKEKRFEDAVGRLYRALELVAQIRLFKKYGIETSRVKPEQVPENLREEYVKKYKEKGEDYLKIPLLGAHNLLYELNDEVWRKWFSEKRNLILDFTQLRNYSFYAHGLKPISEGEFQKALPLMEELTSLVHELQPKTRNFPQLPSELIINPEKL